MAEEITLEAYAREVGRELLEAHNSVDSVAARSVVREAEQNLRDSKIDREAERYFWKLVEREFNSGPRLMQKAENSALHRLLKEIEALLEAKKSQ